MVELNVTPEFVAELLEYYRLSMNDIASSVEKLGTIQKKYPAAYEDFKNVSEKPELLLTLNLGDKEKSILFELLLKSSSLISKVNKLLALTPTEKEALAKDIKSYASEIENKVKELSVKK